MQQLLATDKLYVSKSKIPKGERGVFANSEIKVGDVIERCPVIEIPEHELKSLEESILITYLYFFGEKKQKALVALGFGSIYNHSYTPNAVYKIKVKEKIIEFICTKKIKKDEEILVNYIQGNNDKIPLWFEV